MTDFSYRSHSTYVALASNTVTLDKPAGTPAGDILFSYINRGAGGVPTSSPSGWDLVPGTTNHDMEDLDYTALWYKIAGSSEPASYDWVFSVTTKNTASLHSFYGDINPSNPFDVVSDTEYGTANDIIRAASMTVAKVDSPIIWFGAFYCDTQVPLDVPVSPISFSATPATGNTGSDIYARVAYGIWTSNGSTGVMDGGCTYSSISKHAFAVALAPFTGRRNQIGCVGF